MTQPEQPEEPEPTGAPADVPPGHEAGQEPRAPSSGSPRADARPRAPRRADAREGHEERHRASRRLALRAGAAVALVAAVVAAFTVPVNKVIEAPGPTWNVLADGSGDGSQELVTISGTQTYPAKGALRVTTVSMSGCPGYPVTAVNVIMAWLSQSSTVLDREEVCPEDVTAEEISSQNQTQMTASQNTAVVAALMETGLATSTTLTVRGVSESQSAAGVEEDDVLVSLTPEGGQTAQITTFAQLREMMTTIPQGTTVALDVLRAGQPATSTLTTLPPEEGTEGSRLGLFLEVTADSQVEADFDLSDIGGPSAGLMLALGIVDKVTPGSLTGGQDIAGTGTISVDGQVGEIGGVQQKMAGAAQSGADYFLAPVGNCTDVLDHEPDGLEVFAVGTLHEAVQAVEAIAAGDTSGLPTCSSLQATTG